MFSLRGITRLFVDCPHIQLEAADGETPQHLGVHDLQGKKIQEKIKTDRQNLEPNDCEGSHSVQVIYEKLGLESEHLVQLLSQLFRLQSLTVTATLNRSSNVTRVL